MSYLPFNAWRGRSRAFGSGQRRYRNGADRAEVRGFVAALAGQDFYRNRAAFRDLKKCGAKSLPPRHTAGATRSGYRTRAKSQTPITIAVLHGLTFLTLVCQSGSALRDLFFFVPSLQSLAFFLSLSHSYVSLVVITTVVNRVFVHF